MGRHAGFSPCGRHRDWLLRRWGPPGLAQDVIVFIGLNPSTANAKTDDPTIRRLIRFAQRDGYTKLEMLNLFTLISPDPKVLVGNPDAIGSANRRLVAYSQLNLPVVFCWGAFPEAKHQASIATALFPNALCFGKTKDGHPKHPLYLKADTPLIPFQS